MFRLFDHVIPNSKLPNIKKDMRIACAILNMTLKPVYADNDEVAMAQIMNHLENKENPLKSLVDEQDFDKKRGGSFKPIDSSEIGNFPQLDIEDLYKITLGKYQLKQSLSYVAQHLYCQEDVNAYRIEVCRDRDNFIRAKIQSRHVNSKKYLVYIRYDPSLNDYRAFTEGTSGWFCRCKIGSRTIGCCAHIASVIYYLGYAHRLDNPEPAKALDFICAESEVIADPEEELDIHQYNENGDEIIQDEEEESDLSESNIIHIDNLDDIQNIVFEEDSDIEDDL